jgi:hypothetical protein
MSRINDALKRAQRAQRQNPPLPGVKMPKRLPVESRPGNVIGWILPGVIGFLIVAACLFVGMALVTRTVTKTSSASGVLAAQPATPVAITAPVPAPAAPAPSRPQPPPSPQPSPPPELKLQGIVYATTRPWAIVDGKTVHVGDRLGEFRVQAISQNKVTLKKPDGSQKILGLDK